MAVNPNTKDNILLWAGVAGIVAALVVLLDFVLNRWGYIKRIALWFANSVGSLRPDSNMVALELPDPPPPPLVGIAARHCACDEVSGSPNSLHKAAGARQLS